MGGDELVVISPQGAGPFEAAALLERLTDAVNGDVAFARQRFPLRASIGVAAPASPPPASHPASA